MMQPKHKWVYRLMGGLLCSVLVLASAQTTEKIRPSALAGSWYPASPARLTDLVDDYLAKGANKSLTLTPPIRALILPHAGYRYSGKTAGLGAGLLQGRPYRRVVVLAPTHHSPFHGLSIADVDFYATPLGKVPIDLVAVEQLRESPLVSSEPQAHLREHSIEIQLPLLQRALPVGWQLVPVLVGRLDGQEYAAAARLLRPMLDTATLLVVSSDFTHYGSRFHYQPFPVDQLTASRIQALDEGALQKILHKDVEGFLAYRDRTGITVCGFRPIALLLRLLPEDALLEKIAYTTSAASSGDYHNSVSYLVVVVTSPRPLAVP